MKSQNDPHSPPPGGHHTVIYLAMVTLAAVETAPRVQLRLMYHCRRGVGGLLADRMVEGGLSYSEHLAPALIS